MRLLFSLLVVIALGAGALYVQTEGFTVVTTEASRRASIAQHPRAAPDTTLRFALNKDQGLRQLLRLDGRVVIVNFIYTRCVSVCLGMGSEFQQLQNLIREHGLDDRIRLLSISFDPADTPERLDRYAAAMRADPAVWTFAGMPLAAESDVLLDSFGIVKVAAPYDQFVHNAAYHIVTPDGFLTNIVDLGESAAALRLALAAASARHDLLAHTAVSTGMAPQ